jgi:peptidoglycan/LPS O-acetylase OafA/YrhL
VLAAHTLPRLYGGVVGVDVFFALSGFLITSILIDEINLTGGISRRRFYIRRALRLFPALVFLLVIVAVLQIVGRPSALHDPFFHTEPLAFLVVVGYASNWVIAFGHVQMGLFAHCWSLATEEQFYLVWPWLLLRNLRSSRLVRGLVLVGVAAFGARIVAAIVSGSTAGNAPGNVLRFDGLIAGSVLAIWVYRDSRTDLVARLRRPIVGWACIGVIMAVVLEQSYSVNEAYTTIGFALTGVATTVLIAHLLSRPNGFLPRLFRWPVAVALGRISYGIYLFHFPMVHWLSGLFGQMGTAVVVWVSTGVLALFSWFVIERPALRLKARFETRLTQVAPGSLTPGGGDDSGGTLTAS